MSFLQQINNYEKIWSTISVFWPYSNLVKYIKRVQKLQKWFMLMESGIWSAYPPQTYAFVDHLFYLSVPGKRTTSEKNITVHIFIPRNASIFHWNCV